MLNKYIKKTFLPIALITAMNPVLAVRMALLKTGNKAIFNSSLNKLNARNFSILAKSGFLNNSKAIQHNLLLNQYNSAQSLLKKDARYYFNKNTNNHEKLVKDLINSKEFKDLIQNPQSIKTLINSQDFKNMTQKPQIQAEIEKIIKDLIIQDPETQELFNDIEKYIKDRVDERNLIQALLAANIIILTLGSISFII